MRRYDEEIGVRRGLVHGQEAPEQFLWRGRLWVVREVVAHWVETGAWWERPAAAALLGTYASTGSAVAGGDLWAEIEVWRVEAARSRGPVGQADPGIAPHRPARPAQPAQPGRAGWASHIHGVFDLGFDWGGGQWRLICSID